MPNAPVDPHRYAATRRQVHAVAESLLAGPQYRTTGTIRLAARPDGIAATTVALAICGTGLQTASGTVELAGTIADIAAAAGIVPGPPVGVYAAAAQLPPPERVHLDADAADTLYRSLFAGARALADLWDTQPVLWPEHLDVTVTRDQVNFGVSAGDGFCALPYAYVGPWEPRSGEFWNAPFGAYHPLDLAADTDRLVAEASEFFARGREQH